MSKTLLEYQRDKLIKKAVKTGLLKIVGIVGGAFSLKGLLVAALLFLTLFLAVLVSVTTDRILSYIPSLSCGSWCKQANTSNISKIGENEIPEQYLSLYYAAAQQFAVPWNLLAAVHRIETSFSTDDPMISSAGAIGPMQFMPLTWVGWSYPGGTRLGNADIPNEILTSPTEIARYGGYGMDGDGDGIADPFNNADAIYTAAKYLSANGGSPFDSQKALYAYNHSQVYIDNVLGYANRYADGFTTVQPTTGSALPYDSISRAWMSSITWVNPVNGKKMTGLNAELQAQATARDIRVSSGMLRVLAEISNSSGYRKEIKAQEYAEILQPRNLKVASVKKTGTITTTRTVTEEVKKKDKDGNEQIETVTKEVTETTPVAENLLFITSITTFRGNVTFTVGYEEKSSTVTENGATVTTVMKVPILERTELEANDELLDVALKKAHLRGRQSKLDFLTLVRQFDPNFYDQRVMNRKDIYGWTGSNSGSGTVQGSGILSWPTPGFYNISSPYGWRTHPITGEKKLHAGMDIPVPIGTPVLAADDGEVEEVAFNNEAGNYVRLNHGNGMATRYLHLNRAYVKPGLRIKKGQIIAESGNTGGSTGPHLHFEVILNGQTVDPANYFQSKIGGN